MCEAKRALVLAFLNSCKNKTIGCAYIDPVETFYEQKAGQGADITAITQHSQLYINTSLI